MESAVLHIAIVSKPQYVFSVYCLSYIFHFSCVLLLQVPSSAYSICKVLQKKVKTHCRDKEINLSLAATGCSSISLLQVLILHNNALRSLVPKGFDVGTLSTLKVIYEFMC